MLYYAISNAPIHLISFFFHRKFIFFSSSWAHIVVQHQFKQNAPTSDKFHHSAHWHRMYQLLPQECVKPVGHNTCQRANNRKYSNWKEDFKYRAVSDFSIKRLRNDAGINLQKGEKPTLWHRYACDEGRMFKFLYMQYRNTVKGTTNTALFH